MEWLENFSKAIDYVEQNLDGDISYEEAAKIACCSPNYFQRMFAYVTGITLIEYIRRRRMTQAAFELQTKDMKVLDVAIKYGYTSPTAFNRAFQSVHGINPAVAKSQGCQLCAYPPIKFSIQIQGGNDMPYRIEEKAPMRIVGVRIPLTNEIDKNYQLIPSLWEQTKQNGMFNEILNLNKQLEKSIFGISIYDSKDEIYYYIATVTNKPVPEGMYECEIPKSAWAVFECKGPFKESIQIIYKRFFTEWLPFSGYKHAEIGDVELYSVYDEEKVSGYSEMWMSIKKERK
ncbi:AraC family transcriptional regulator [Clostridium saccharoperbutylacetonicum]|uniref:Putative HTH-type transcriptional regulator YdeE n=1 Tax=Clostridium saccharoperbutylacetonicum N1-4(HMT) TaxID=931276 RepID=M1MHP6_9CLOT|nr:AraC family transcriptional regulator [Clostridium saccharoperbutylacetonicum]AGF55828.1 putative HTH-type transcriptional regulator YdeE [Clostridium saccharoperbutylacetonicum N1-4(HMT)]NRT63438.1 AraC family transcriptional regulator [Clostridium saccharoperbutylacetonicum]NSB26800.1 AraC family transcriptional regulator [Clostridium saccharoperbutylacetonicum]NSB40279.1 AraC family transcriptional regulator [Clostridium saccharoperbutylacetonicum]